MNREDIIRMAREAGLRSAVLLHLYGGKEAALTDSELDELRGLEYFAALVAAHEREECAKLAEDHKHDCYEGDLDWYEAGRIADAIRANGQA